ncbi:MAG: hypothetical protein HKO59_11615 [Phycisphaerales bacterium]|nr:hypothetical protein [Phycisphaerae bacterium]NNF41439.1 hypothetical protein [Phycisphaerales bacterium]NNM26610.1 hypothetical protein [Phycisphaerales bacterium]
MSRAMETSLHRQLKDAYAEQGGQLEMRLGSYRIDVARADDLVEIQHGPLAAIRDKVRDLVERHRVLVVKPIVRRKQLVKRETRGGRIVGRRLSPKRGRIMDVFDELVHFTRVFPHPNLTVEVAMVDVEEWRYPGHGRRRRRRPTDFVVEDQRLVRVDRCARLHDADDLIGLLPGDLPSPFDTADLAATLGVARGVAQRVAYCLRETGAVATAGKQGNAWLYRRCA